MIQNACPACGGEIPAQSINVAEGVALCPGCGKLSRLADVASGRKPAAEVLRKPPAGCSITDLGDQIVVQASLRSIGGFLGLCFFSLFWNSIVSVFVLIALAGIYKNLIGPVPDWFPAPKGENDGINEGLGGTLFLCIFLTPFVVIGIGTAFMALMNLIGKVQVRIGDHDADVTTGIGFLAWRRRFDPNQVRRVKLDKSTSQGEQKVIALEMNDNLFKFGTLLEEQRLEWMEAVLHELLVAKQPNQRRDALAQTN